MRSRENFQQEIGTRMCEISCWKKFTAEYNTWEKEVDLKNVKEVVVKFEGKISMKIRR